MPSIYVSHLRPRLRSPFVLSWFVYACFYCRLLCTRRASLQPPRASSACVMGGARATHAEPLARAPYSDFENFDERISMASIEIERRDIGMPFSLFCDLSMVLFREAELLAGRPKSCASPRENSRSFKPERGLGGCGGGGPMRPVSCCVSMGYISCRACWRASPTVRSTAD